MDIEEICKEYLQEKKFKTILAENTKEFPIGNERKSFSPYHKRQDLLNDALVVYYC